MPREWSADAVGELLARLARHGGFLHHGRPSESKLAKAHGVSQQTMNSWKAAKREPSTLREFLRHFAQAYRLDEVALLHEWEIRSASARAPSPTASSGMPAPPELGRLEAFAARLAHNPQLAEIRKRAPGFWEKEWLPLERAVMDRAKREVDAVIQRAHEELEQRRAIVLKLWRAERGPSR